MTPITNCILTIKNIEPVTSNSSECDMNELVNEEPHITISELSFYTHCLL